MKMARTKKYEKLRTAIKIASVSFLVPVIVSYITTRLTIYIQQPNIEVLGVLPLHLDKRTILKGDNSEIVLHNHRFGLILKMKNDSATETTTNLAIIVGCVPIGPLDADMGLPEKDRIQNGMRLDETF